MRRKRVVRQKKAVKFVAVVMRSADIASRRKRGDWSCFVADTKEVAVNNAIQAVNAWREEHGDYDILVGQLESRVHIPVQFELVKI